MKVQFVLHSNYSDFVRGIIARYKNGGKTKSKERHVISGWHQNKNILSGKSQMSTAFHRLNENTQIVAFKLSSEEFNSISLARPYRLKNTDRTCRKKTKITAEMNATRSMIGFFLMEPLISPNPS